jgi:hypothetical protein
MKMDQHGGEQAVAGSVRRQDIQKWLGERLLTRMISLDALDPVALQMQILDWP